MEESNNVVQFSSFSKSIRVPDIPEPTKSKELISTGVDNLKTDHINGTLEVLIPMIFNKIDLSRFDVVDEEADSLDIKNGAMVIESIRSILCAHYGLHHPFQDLADNLFFENDAGEFTIRKNLTLTIKENDK